MNARVGSATKTVENLLNSALAHFPFGEIYGSIKYVLTEGG